MLYIKFDLKINNKQKNFRKNIKKPRKIRGSISFIKNNFEILIFFQVRNSVNTNPLGLKFQA
jgi:hypothetical protein